MKIDVDDSNWIRPMPNAIISCRSKDGHDNALAVGVASVASIDPVMVMIGIIPSRFSYDMVKDTGKFVVNIPTKEFSEKYMYLGTVSGRDEDKLASINTTDADIIDAPILTDCPINYECSLIDVYSPGSHDLFIGKVEKVHCDDKYLTKEKSVNWEKIDLL